MADKPQPRPVVRLKLRNFRPIKPPPGEKDPRRFYNIKTGEEISRREFAARAKRVVVYEAPKPKLSIHQKRVKWYANHYNHEQFDAQAAPDDFISFEQVEDDPTFQMYESMIHSRDADIRAVGYDYFDDLEYEYENEDWGETPGAA